MGFIRSGKRSEKNLTEMANQLIALQYSGIARGVVSEPEKGRKVSQDVVRARVVLFNEDGTQFTHLGETLVYQTIIAQDLADKPGDWHGGILTEIPQKADSDRTVWRLNPPENDRVFDNMEAALAAKSEL